MHRDNEKYTFLWTERPAQYSCLYKQATAARRQPEIKENSKHSLTEKLPASSVLLSLRDVTEQGIFYEMPFTYSVCKIPLKWLHEEFEYTVIPVENYTFDSTKQMKKCLNYLIYNIYKYFCNRQYHSALLHREKNKHFGIAMSCSMPAQLCSIILTTVFSFKVHLILLLSLWYQSLNATYRN